jgi:CDP-paratose 2-epimerase
MKKILITGGAGFAGSNLATLFRSHYPNSTITCFDNLKRRGSELALSRLRENGIQFVHGDVRIKDDLFELEKVDLIIDCAAEPSVMAGTTGSPDYVIQTNLNGTLNCLELARRDGAAIVFLSTSRVYPVDAINALTYEERQTRYVLSETQSCPGASSAGISEDFPLTGARSIYGASKLSSELMLQEYVTSYGIKGIINRCGVLTGPWQMGKVDQGVIVLWVAKHIFDGELSYIGYGGLGKQVRDILHISDLFNLLTKQLKSVESWNSEVFNVGGGVSGSVSLCELTTMCREFTGKTIPVHSSKETRPNDLLCYLSDCAKVQKRYDWKPQVSPPQIISEIADWIRGNATALKPILA